MDNILATHKMLFLSLWLPVEIALCVLVYVPARSVLSKW